METVRFVKVGTQQFSNIVEAATKKDVPGGSLDLGHVELSVLAHPKLGDIIAITTPGNFNAIGLNAAALPTYREMASD